MENLIGNGDIMGLIFASFIFLLFDLNVTSYEIDILPDFLGWMFMLLATFKMSDIIKYAPYAKTAEIFMLVVSVPYEVMSLLPGIKGLPVSFFYAICKLASMTFVLFCFSKLKERVKSIVYYDTAAKVWLVFLAVEAVYFVFAGLIESKLPEGVAMAITQAVVITLLFTQVLFLIFLRKAQKSIDLK